MPGEAMYPDGSLTQAHEGGGFSITGPIAIQRVRLITAKSALEVFIRTEGRMQVTRNGAQLAIRNVIEPLTGKAYKRSMNGKREALADCIVLIRQIDDSAVVIVDIEGG